MKRIALYLLAIVLSLPAYAQEHEGFAVNRGVRIYYKAYGTGQPILIINGGPGMNSAGFEPFAKALSKNAQAILFDQRGTGRSIPARIDSSTITMDLMVADIESIRRELHIEKWVVLGQSFGGMLASYYTTRYPQRVAGLILSASGGLDLTLLKDFEKRINVRLSRQEKDSLAFWNQRIYRGDTSHTALLGVCRARAAAYVYNKTYIVAIAERLTQMRPKVSSLVWRDMRRIHFNCKPKLATFTRPVLIIQGKQDILNPDMAMTAKQILPNARLVLMDRCGHWGWLERPDIYYPAVERLMREAVN